MSKPTLVLLPGLDGTGDLFEPFVAALGANFKSIVISYPVADPMDYRSLEALVRKRLPATEDFCLLGESFSGPIAISIAANPPPNLVAMVLCCTFVINPQPRLAFLRCLLPMANPRLAPLWVISALLMGNRSTAALRTALARALTPVSSAVFRARLLAVLGVDVSHKLAQVSKPTLYLQALQDRLVPSVAASLALQANPHMQVVRLDGPHFLLQVCPREASEALEAFFQS
jgi:pimeloyl-[acyl-carrier protein] methyl ester esterase